MFSVDTVREYWVGICTRVFFANSDIACKVQRCVSYRYFTDCCRCCTGTEERTYSTTLCPLLRQINTRSSTLQYFWPRDFCSVHGGETCPILPWRSKICDSHWLQATVIHQPNQFWPLFPTRNLTSWLYFVVHQRHQARQRHGQY